MALNKIRYLDQDTVGVTLPKDDLRFMGLVDADGELVDDIYAHIRLEEDDSGWSVTLVEEIDA